MKTKQLKTLKLQKCAIANLTVQKLAGGAFVTKDVAVHTCHGETCGICDETERHCTDN
ncbi:hypothetical protein H2O64_21320 [Kordia sp. YSTF-M3]|uniref:Class I lanthipeptide n=1 Tax=Kordia aestuariivivens TaxID=2759037 RepID=A0ABR7QFA7_9FLAO|nr:hypothetical protein [Kordia aestuariivivens]MBC8757224.1 hypothetical protein [Kordia aestuariivivens]